MDEKRCLDCALLHNLSSELSNDEKKLIQYRFYVNRLCFESGWSKNRITRELGVSKHFVIKWTQSPDQDVTVDLRGWPKGHRRKWVDQTEQRIASIYKELIEAPSEFFAGATAVSHRWSQQHSDSPPPLRTIGQIMKDLNLSEQKKKGRLKGAAQYLRYPEKTVYGGYLGDRVMEADFIERRYLKGSGTPLHFVGFSAKKAPKLRYFKRIEALTADHFIQICDHFFDQFETPDVLKMDNASTFIGSLSGKRTLSRTMIYLLSRKVIPVLSVPRRPFTQASIEGNNSVFSRYFWKRRTFENVAEVDRQLEWFNASSLRYTDYKRPNETDPKETFVPRVYFLRQVRESETAPGQGFIGVANEEVLLPAFWINFFVLAEWNLKTQRLTVFIEQDQKLNKLSEIKFSINNTTQKKLKQGGALLSCI